MKTKCKSAADDYVRWKDELAATSRGRHFLELHQEETRTQAKQEVAVIVDELRSVLKRKSTDADRQADLLRVLRGEFEEFGRYIQKTRHEIAALVPEEDGSSWIKTARGELDAIVLATEQATYDILGAAEEVQRLVGLLPGEGASAPVREALESQVTAILTACSFQDITGQRTTKVVNALRFLEARVNTMIEIWGSSVSDRAETGPIEQRPDGHLLNGPALAGGISQDDVDSLLLKAAPALAVAESASQADIDALFK
jgi:chemotaxis regulatin CheY-phosphate phosphatase CheZ